MQGCSGLVTSFNFGANGVGGFGFIQSDQADGDVYFKRTDLPEDLKNFGYNGVVKGCHVTFDLKYTNEGKAQGVNINLSPRIGEPMVGTVASYSNQNRYGFIESPHVQEKVYFQQKELPEAMQSIDGNRLKGQTVQFKLELKPDGKPWGKSIKLHKMIMPNAIKKAQQAHQQQPQPHQGALSFPVKRPMGGGVVIAPAKKPRMGMAPSQKPQPMKQQQHLSGNIGPRKTGVVKSYSDGKGFGFIGCPGVPQGDVYFQRVSLANGSSQDVTVGRKLSFNLVHTPEGRPQAKEVMLQ